MVTSIHKVPPHALTCAHLFNFKRIGGCRGFGSISPAAWSDENWIFPTSERGIGHQEFYLLLIYTAANCSLATQPLPSQQGV